MATTNYSLPLFTGTGSVDLLGIYNTAMNTIDSELKKINDSIGTINSTLSSLQGTVSGLSSQIPTQSSGDKIFDVSSLAGAKMTSTGFVYFDAE